MTPGTACRTSPVLLIVLVAALVTLAGCAAGTASDSNLRRSDPSEGSPATIDIPSPPKCGDLDGKTGVIESFCTGPGTATFDIGGQAGSITGGECREQGGYWLFNAGTMRSSEYKGMLPDYVEVALAADNGKVASNTVTASITTGGRDYSIRNAVGTHDADTTLLTGSTQEGGEPVTVHLRC
ncbi:MAG: hypothetical protein JWO77_1482 [Ilumatobacteraceae bacterium]|nr:hypothetical protein [Ilumatobacteraceae bacterium]